MTEYATVIEVWFYAENDQDACAIRDGLGERVNEHPSVSVVEVSSPERTE